MINLAWFVLGPILAGVLFYFLPERWVKLASLITQAGLVAAAVANFIQVRLVGQQSVVLGGWTDHLGITLRSDLLSAVMILLTTLLFVLFLVYSYSQDYVKHLFVSLLVLQQGLMIGVFLAGDLFNLYVLLEVITLIVTLLIQFKREKRSIYDGLIYLMTQTVAMLFYLFGLGLLYRQYGVFDFERLGELIRQTDEPRRLILPFALIMTAVTVKAALFPLFSWLPKAHGTPGSPTVVSALLSGLSVKMGLYLFIRVTALFAPQINLTRFYLVVGFLTGLVAVILAMRQTDIKRILAYSTISQIGLILIGLSYGTPRAFWGAIYHLINHALFKSALFLVAGLIVEIWGSRNIRKISYVYRHVPFISIAALLAILGITGAPLFNGSISKYLIGSDLDGTIFEYGLVLLNLGTMVVFVRFASLFFGKPAGAGQGVSPGHLIVPLSRRIVVGLLGLICFVGGLFGSTFVSTLFGLDVRISLDDFGIKFLIYLITLAGGILINHLLRKPLANLPSCARHEPGFNRMSLAMVANFAILAGYLALTLPV